MNEDLQAFKILGFSEVGELKFSLEGLLGINR